MARCFECWSHSKHRDLFLIISLNTAIMVLTNPIQPHHISLFFVVHNIPKLSHHFPLQDFSLKTGHIFNTWQVFFDGVCNTKHFLNWFSHNSQLFLLDGVCNPIRNVFNWFIHNSQFTIHNYFIYLKKRTYKYCPPKNLLKHWFIQHFHYFLVPVSCLLIVVGTDVAYC